LTAENAKSAERRREETGEMYFTTEDPEYTERKEAKRWGQKDGELANEWGQANQKTQMEKLNSLAKKQRFDRLYSCLLVVCLLLLLLLASPAAAQRQLEKLGRGVVAIRQSSTQVYVGWRMLGTDPDDTAFNLYRVTSGVTNLVVAATTNTCNFVD